MPHPSRFHLSASAAIVLLVAGTSLLAIDSRTSPRFYADDPLAREPETQDASRVQEWDIDLAADLLINMFSGTTSPASIDRAHNVNTIDEVPDSSWFTNRIYGRPLSIDELLRGPNTIDGPAVGRWTVIRPKSAGFAPGFTVRDEGGEVWFLTFDPKGTPRAATGAIAVACRIFWALGYYQVESYLSRIKPEDLVIAETATIRRRSGSRRPMNLEDVREVLDRAARDADGSYRVLAARAVPGRVLGGFRYVDTRPDDPNDIVPHEHRRELRALKVFGAWTNLVDMKAGNTLDTLITENGRGIVRHYLQDVGSTFGTGARGPRDWDEGYEYLYEGSPLWKRLVTFGFYRQPWQTASYVENPEIGRFEGDTFDPERWRSRVPTKAVRYARDDDTFWAALRVGAFTDDMIRAVVTSAQYEDEAAADLLAEVLIKRRDKIVRAYLPKIAPMTRFALSDDGLRFENAAVRAGVAEPPRDGYRATWYAFDNDTGEARALGAPTRSTIEHLEAPSALTPGNGAYLKVEVSAVDADRGSWATPVDVYFQRRGRAWTLVGVWRMPVGLTPEIQTRAYPPAAE